VLNIALQRVAEITPKLYHITAGRPHSSWAISLAELLLRILQTDQPVVLLPGTGVMLQQRPLAREDDVDILRNLYFSVLHSHVYGSSRC